jgi:hypothetical protein
MAGRNISASYAAFTSARVMATCAVEGQAIGTAAAQCIEQRLAPRELARDPKQLGRLQQSLLRDDQTIKNLRNQDPLDLARTATVTASAESGSAKASLVTDGITRNIPDKRGDPAELHQWAAPSPAWIELRWPKPQRIRTVEITFDTGFKRQLTLSAQDSQNVNLLRAPQPETVRDYRVLCGARTVAEVKGNFQRKRRHDFDAVETDTVRVEVAATNGDPDARIFEIRCYA